MPTSTTRRGLIRELLGGVQTIEDDMTDVISSALALTQAPVRVTSASQASVTPVEQRASLSPETLRKTIDVSNANIASLQPARDALNGVDALWEISPPTPFADRANAIAAGEIKDTVYEAIKAVRGSLRGSLGCLPKPEDFVLKRWIVPYEVRRLGLRLLHNECS